jgi:tetratricopeptide (TPR) repeat protein
LDYILRGSAKFLKPPARDDYAEMITLFERALALAPGSAETLTALALALANRVPDSMSDSAAADIARAEGLVAKALAASPRSALAHFAKGQVLRAQNRCEEAIPEYETVTALDRNWADALAGIGRCKTYVGPIEEAIPFIEQAVRLSPRDSYIGVWYWRIGVADLLQSRIDEAIVWFEKARRANPAHALSLPISPPPLP